jgi:ABC-type phosphate transport system permease subunit
MLGPFSSLAVCAVLYTSIVIVVHGFTDSISGAEQHAIVAADHQKLDSERARAFEVSMASFQAIPIICFGMFCHFTIVPATHTLKPYWPSEGTPGKTRMRTVGVVCIVVMMICVVVYTPVGVLGYLTFGSQTAVSDHHPVATTNQPPLPRPPHPPPPSVS